MSAAPAYKPERTNMYVCTYVCNKSVSIDVCVCVSVSGKLQPQNFLHVIVRQRRHDNGVRKRKRDEGELLQQCCPHKIASAKQTRKNAKRERETATSRHMKRLTTTKYTASAEAEQAPHTDNNTNTSNSTNTLTNKCSDYAAAKRERRTKVSTTGRGALSSSALLLSHCLHSACRSVCVEVELNGRDDDEVSVDVDVGQRSKIS